MAEMASYCFVAPVMDATQLTQQIGAVTTSVNALLNEQDGASEASIKNRLLAMQQGALAMALLAQHLTDDNRPAITWIKAQLMTVLWTKPALTALLKEAQIQFSVKTPQVMMPLRIMLTGSAQAPAVDALLLTLGREESLRRIHG